MKKVISAILSLVMVLSVCASFNAYAEAADYGETPGYYSDSDAPDYYYLNLMQGKKAGEIYGFFEAARRIAARLDGCEEIEKDCRLMLDKVHSAFGIARDACDAICEVEQDKLKMNMLDEAANSDCLEIIEGLAASLGDPSSTARNSDVIIAAANVAISDAKSAMENKNRKTAQRALLELADGEKCQKKLIISCNGMDLFDKYNSLDDYYERVQAAKNKTQADIEKSNALVDSYIAEFYSIIALMDSAYEKLVPLAESFTDEAKVDYNTLINVFNNHEKELRGDFMIEYFKYEQVDMSRFDSMLGEYYREKGILLLQARENIMSTIMPRFFLLPNNFTADGTAHPLVTLGYDMEGIDKTQIKYALGNMPDTVTDEAVVADASLPDEAYGSEIPTVKKEGTYYVYCRFPNGESGTFDFCVKVTVAKATPVPPKPVKKANTIYAKGKTVKVNGNKKTIIKKSKAFKIKNAKGTVTFKKAKGNKKITVAKNGKITVKKGLKKGTYKVKIKVTAAGNSRYKAATKTVTVKIIIR